VSPDGRAFQLDDGAPFFYLADTAWTLFTRLTFEEALRYFDDRAAKGFTVVQAYVLRGLWVANREGERPLRTYNPSNINERFFENVDALVEAANERGLVMSLVTTFGEHVRGGNLLAAEGRHSEVIFDEDNAFSFGALLSERYSDACVMWVLGGDRNPLRSLPVWERMAQGLKQGCPEALVSFHGPGGTSSSYWFHWAKWLDFNTIQSGHARNVPNYLFVWHDRALDPAKPTLDMEPRYENHPDRNDPSGKVIDAMQVRNAGYWALLAGAAGHGYGANDIWQFARPHDDLPEDYTHGHLPATVAWEEALDFEGAWSMTWLRQLAERYRWYRWGPVMHPEVRVEGAGSAHLAVASDRDSGFAVLYVPPAQRVHLMLEPLGMTSAHAQWYDPRTGAELEGGELTITGQQVLETPAGSSADDWVLVLRGET
jgi:Protein of unknown function (DUF4038)/Putative collagen-binding domain of a collagenase